MSVRPLTAGELHLVQALFEASPSYFLVPKGRPPCPDEARIEFDEVPPPSIAYGDRWFAGIFDVAGELIGILHVLSEYMRKDVWHIAFLFMAEERRRSGLGKEVFEGFQSLALERGAKWLRLGVIERNTTSRQFWESCGFIESRVRHNVDTGGAINNVRIMCKPLDGGLVSDYWQIAPRDKPDTPFE